MSVAERYDNLTGQVHCKTCCDDGLVGVGQDLYAQYTRLKGETVATGRTFAQDVYGPCPACAKGHQVEFPPDGRWGPWGKDGFWQGRPWRDLGVQANSCRCNLPRAPKEVALAALRAMRDTIAAVKVVDVLPKPRTVLAVSGPSVDPSRAIMASQDVPTPPPTIASPDVTESDPPVTVGDAGPIDLGFTGRHRCPHYTPPRDMPFSEAECALCTPTTPKDEGDPF